jgi:hypothetical protein
MCFVCLEIISQVISTPTPLLHSPPPLPLWFTLYLSPSLPPCSPFSPSLPPLLLCLTSSLSLSPPLPSFRCILWPISGLAGESAQLAYVELISQLVTLIIPNHSLTSSLSSSLTSSLSSSTPLPLIQQSLLWSKDPFVDTLSALLTLISSPPPPPPPPLTSPSSGPGSGLLSYSENSKCQLLILFSQYLQILFVDYIKKYKIILKLLKDSLLKILQRESYQTLLSSRSELGYVGGWISSRPTHSFLSIPSQCQTLLMLELFVFYNYQMIPNLSQEVLQTLYDCHELLERESQRQHHIISPLIDQRLNLAIRRVKFYCLHDRGGLGDGVEEGTTGAGAGTGTGRGGGSQNQPLPAAAAAGAGGGGTPRTPQGMTTPPSKKMISNRRVSSAFTTFDNSMSDAFMTPEASAHRTQKQRDEASLFLTTPALGNGHGNGNGNTLGIVNTMFKIPISSSSFTLPIDVEKEFSIFSSYASKLDQYGPTGDLSSPSSSSPFSLSSLSSSSSSSAVCTSDLIGLIDDVLDAHLIVNPSLFQRLPTTLPSLELIQRSQLLSQTYDLRDSRQWKQVNGSSDMFTVLCTVISYNPITADARVAVRIINSSGFKVPLFSVQLLLSSTDTLPVTDAAVAAAVAATSPAGCRAIKASFDSSKTSSILDGVEYFHLDGLVERVFTVHFHEFSNSFLHLRLIYRDLIAETDSIEIFTIPFPTVPGAQGGASPGSSSLSLFLSCSPVLSSSPVLLSSSLSCPLLLSLSFPLFPVLPYPPPLLLLPLPFLTLHR